MKPQTCGCRATPGALGLTAGLRCCSTSGRRPSRIPFECGVIFEASNEDPSSLRSCGERSPVPDDVRASDYGDPMSNHLLGIAADVLRAFGSVFGGRHLAIIGGA